MHHHLKLKTREIQHLKTKKKESQETEIRGGFSCDDGMTEKKGDDGDAVKRDPLENPIKT